jgi:hypothetical protein
MSAMKIHDKLLAEKWAPPQFLAQKTSVLLPKATRRILVVIDEKEFLFPSQSALHKRECTPIPQMHMNAIAKSRAEHHLSSHVRAICNRIEINPRFVLPDCSRLNKNSYSEFCFIGIICASFLIEMLRVAERRMSHCI